MFPYRLVSTTERRYGKLQQHASLLEPPSEESYKLRRKLHGGYLSSKEGITKKI
jgi:hypothetical protein